MVAAIDITGMHHRYGKRHAVRGLTMRIEPGEVFALLGPNGSGKTTLFRVLSTLIRLQEGSVSIYGGDLQKDRRRIQSAMGVVFQAPSVDRKLTVKENLRHQGALYGLSGATLRARMAAMLEQLGIVDRTNERVERLSGGLRRRVELAKGLLHHPRLLLMDEPSTGLDPGARADLWNYLQRIRSEEEVTIVLTTHLLDEADRADRIGIMNEGNLVALDTPERLRATVGGDAVTLETTDAEAVRRRLAEQLGVEAQVVDGRVRLEVPDGHRWIERIVNACPDEIQSITLGKPTLEDVFIQRTGHRFWQDGNEESA